MPSGVSDEAHGRTYLSAAQGIVNVSERRVVDFRWQDWKLKTAWMTLYFSVAAWISISLMRAALRGAQRRRDASGPRGLPGPIRGHASGAFSR
jgi:hypothetical protein